jgi:hypothetical protein
MNSNSGKTMAKKTFYEKQGRRYVPVAEYDSEWLDSFPKGTHLVMVYPGGSSRRFNIDPNYAAMIAAGRVAEDAVSRAIMAAGELRLNSKLRNRPMTEEQRAAWQHLIEVFGEDAQQLEWASVRECAEAGVNAMIAEADKLMSNPAVRKAWERFQMICELTKQQQGKVDA